MRIVAILLMSLFACTGPESGDVPVQLYDFEVFESTVQPIIADKCGNPSCHGRPERAFSIFSERNWRLDDDQLYLPEPLSEEELENNFISTCMQIHDGNDFSDSLLLLKPLGDVAGTYHGGGTIFEDETDRSYRAIMGWLESGIRTRVQ
ncbi:MAG: hypothetical protein GY811_16205 [Myxococcales bacterium]|nr:hypothetical protein [Myxococcales bacterium]